MAWICIGVFFAGSLIKLAGILMGGNMPGGILLWKIELGGKLGYTFIFWISKKNEVHWIWSLRMFHWIFNAVFKIGFFQKFHIYKKYLKNCLSYGSLGYFLNPLNKHPAHIIQKRHFETFNTRFSIIDIYYLPV